MKSNKFIIGIISSLVVLFSIWVLYLEMNEISHTEAEKIVKETISKEQNVSEDDIEIVVIKDSLFSNYFRIKVQWSDEFNFGNAYIDMSGKTGEIGFIDTF